MTYDFKTIECLVKVGLHSSQIYFWKITFEEEIFLMCLAVHKSPWFPRYLKKRHKWNYSAFVLGNPGSKVPSTEAK